MAIPQDIQIGDITHHQDQLATSVQPPSLSTMKAIASKEEKLVPLYTVLLLLIFVAVKSYVSSPICFNI